MTQKRLRPTQLLARLAALAAALSLVFGIALAKRGVFHCADGTWHVIACCAQAPVDPDVTADEPACCQHVDVTVVDLREDAALPQLSVPPVSVAITLFGPVRWGTLDLPDGEPSEAPTGPPPRASARRLSLLSTLRS